MVTSVACDREVDHRKDGWTAQQKTAMHCTYPYLRLTDLLKTGHHGETGFVIVKLELPEHADSSTSPWH